MGKLHEILVLVPTNHFHTVCCFHVATVALNSCGRGVCPENLTGFTDWLSGGNAL